MSNLGMIGIEVEPVKNTGIWAESGKSYDELTVEDMKAAFSKHNPGSSNAFIDGGKFTYPGIENGTWDVATSQGRAGKIQLVRLILHLKISQIICTILVL